MFGPCDLAHRDTVASVGFIPSKHLPLTASNGGIKIVRQALALDERRVRFTPALWHRHSQRGMRGKGMHFLKISVLLKLIIIPQIPILAPYCRLAHRRAPFNLLAHHHSR